MTAVDQEYRWKRFGPAPTLPTFSATETQPPETAPVDEQARGYEAGYAAGEAAGRAAAEAREQQCLTTVEQLAAELTRTRDGIVSHTFQEMADVLRVLFEQLFLHELRTGPELITTLCEEMQRALQSDSVPRVLLSSNDYDALQGLAQPLSGLDIAEDANLPGGVIRAIVGKSVAELDVVGNLQDVLKQALQDTHLDAADFVTDAPADGHLVDQVSDAEVRPAAELPDDAPDPVDGDTP